MLRGLRTTALVAFFALCSPAVAHAADAEKARDLAGQAADKLDAKSYQEAYDLADTAEKLYHAPPHLLIMGRAQEGLGKLPEAKATYERIVAEQLPKTAPLPFREAQTEAKKQLAGITDKARDLAGQAADKLDAKSYKEALELATQAEVLFHAPPHLLMVARSQEELGQLADAMASYERLTAESLPSTVPAPFIDAQAEGRSRLTALAARVPSLLLIVSGPGKEGAAATVDGKPYDLSGGSLRINPGKHAVHVTSSGYPPIDREVELPQKRGDVRIEVSPEKVKVNTVVAPPPEPAAWSPKSKLFIPMVALGGVGVAGLIGGAVTGGLSMGKVSDLKGQCTLLDPTSGANTGCPESARATYDSAKTLGTVSTALLVVGGVGVAGAVTVLVVGRSKTPERQASFEPLIGPGSIGLKGVF